MYYIFIENEEINGCGQCPILNEEIKSVEVSEDIFNEFIEDSDKYIWNGKDIVKNPDYDSQQAELKRADLVQTLYNIKSERAYGGVIINDAFKFETNQTSITNTVGSVAFMSDTDVANWKFYSLDGAPVTYAVTKAQLYAIAKFGRDMIDKCFKVEANFNADLAQATQDDLLSAEWVQEFIENATSAMEAVVNTLTVELAEERNEQEDKEVTS
jgi:hypothetical protein